MSEWWTYRPGSFLMFSARTYQRLIERYNADTWPVQALAIAAGLLALACAWRARSTLQQRIAPALLTAAWCWVAWAFLQRRFAPINLAAEYAAWAFAAQGVALFWVGVVRGRMAGAREPTPTRVIGALVVTFALVGYPLLAPALGRPWSQAEAFGAMPDPTAIATLGFLLLADRSPGWLMVVPALSAALGGAMLWTLHAPEAWLGPAIAALVIVCWGWRRLRPLGDTGRAAES